MREEEGKKGRRRQEREEVSQGRWVARKIDRDRERKRID